MASQAGGEISPAAAELVLLVARIVVGVAAVLNTLQDPQDTGRHNLQALRA